MPHCPPWMCTISLRANPTHDACYTPPRTLPSPPHGTLPPSPRPAPGPHLMPAAAGRPSRPRACAPGPAPARRALPARPRRRGGGGCGCGGGGRQWRPGGAVLTWGAGWRCFRTSRRPGVSMLISPGTPRGLHPGLLYLRTCVLPYCSSCLWYIWNSNYILGAHACFFISLCLFLLLVLARLRREPLLPCLGLCSRLY